MSEYTLSNSAAVIDSAITRVVNADTEPTANSDNMVTSKGVKTAIDELASSSILTVNSFTPAALETSTDGLTETDDAIPTSKAVQEAVDDRKYSTGWTDVSFPSNGKVTGTAVTDMFFIGKQTPTSSKTALINFYINNDEEFRVSASRKQSSGTDSVTDAVIYVPVAKGENYKFIFNDDLLNDQYASLKYKTFG